MPVHRTLTWGIQLIFPQSLLSVVVEASATAPQITRTFGDLRHHQHHLVRIYFVYVELLQIKALCTELLVVHLLPETIKVCTSLSGKLAVLGHSPEFISIPILEKCNIFYFQQSQKNHFRPPSRKRSPSPSPSDLTHGVVTLDVKSDNSFPTIDALWI